MPVNCDLIVPVTESEIGFEIGMLWTWKESTGYEHRVASWSSHNEKERTRFGERWVFQGTVSWRLSHH